MRASRLIAVLTLYGTALMANPVPDAALNDLDWRLLGPFRGGWSTVAVGVPESPDTYYFGAAGGGVWKTTDSGKNWRPIFDQQAASVGAVAVAPSDPRVIYVGTGQPQARYDTAAGDGVYGSRDGGQSWSHLGLTLTRHIGAISVDPADANTVLVAALGPLYAQSPDRGVYRSSDGGQSWTRTLAIDDATGAVDLARDPPHPQRIYAAAWESRNYPWMSYFTPMVGKGSGIYRSEDGGLSWTRLQGEGWPEDAVGRIGLAVAAHGVSTRIYAVVDSEASGGLYRSDDDGAHWQRVQANPELGSSYFGRVTVDPDDADTVYIMDRSIRVSHDAGLTLSWLRGSPGGDDYHDLWINPLQPQHLIAASDQGTVVSSNGGDSWSDWYNQPTGQFYCLHVDQRFPYWLYAGQQDNGSVAITSRSDYGAISFRDWHPVGADERDCDVPDPDDANIVYGSGLGGRVGRFDARTGDVQNISPSLINSYGRDPRTVEHRWAWMTPLTISPLAPHSLFLGAQILWRSDDRGQNWRVISGDLTGKTREAAECAGEVAQSDARACGFGVIYTIAPSPHDAEEVWVGTDSGLLQRTRDGGQSWENLTPPTLPEWGIVSRIELSALDRNTVYLAVDRHRLNQFAPMIFRSHDGGQSWTEISAGLPPGEFSSVVRADPVQAGLLFVGTDRGVYTSVDDGAHWQPLSRQLPVAWVRDMRVVGDDLAIATQGRGLWILDNISRLRALAQQPVFSAPRLFPPAAAIRLRQNQNKDTPLAAEIPLGRNPPTGALIEYYLPKPASTVELRILAADGSVIRQFSSADEPEDLPSEQYFSDLYRRPRAGLPLSAGAHRWVWNLRHPRPLALNYDFTIAAVAGIETERLPQGPLALPGPYTVELIVDGRKQSAPLSVRLDPRLSLSESELGQILAFNQQIGRTLASAVDRIRKLSADLDLLTKAPAKADTEVRTAAIKAELDGQSGKTGLKAWAGILAGLATDAESAERVPTTAQQALLSAAIKALETRPAAG
ncbi:MAG: WD40/YVTN/BNR-like repeat-containing protein [Lysobacterales bacterium]